jgi:hypothetical protein
LNQSNKRLFLRVINCRRRTRRHLPRFRICMSITAYIRNSASWAYGSGRIPSTPL